MEIWKLKNPQICDVCIIHTQNKGISDYNLLDSRTDFIKHHNSGAWKIYERKINGKKFLLALYRSRLFIFYNPEITNKISTDDFLRNYAVPIINGELKQLNNELINIFQAQVLNIFHYPIVTSCSFEVVKDKNDFENFFPDISWLGDAVTTFYYPVFDSYKNTHGYIRISRHVTISYGLSSPIIREMINLIYEEILNRYRTSTNYEINFGEAEKALLEGLSRHTIPSQMNLFFQGLAMKTSLYLASVGFIITILGLYSSYLSVLKMSFLYISVLVLSIIGWFILSKYKMSK